MFFRPYEGIVHYYYVTFYSGGFYPEIILTGIVLWCRQPLLFPTGF